jgi:hypothetical protein
MKPKKGISPSKKGAKSKVIDVVNEMRASNALINTPTKDNHKRQTRQATNLGKNLNDSPSLSTKAFISPIIKNDNDNASIIHLLWSRHLLLNNNIHDKNTKKYFFICIRSTPTKVQRQN